MHPAISPVLLGRSESLLTGIDLLKLGFQCVEHVSTSASLHVVLRK